MKKNNDISGIVLLSKQPGKTSFSSLSSVKRALGTTKVGHTGTLDSFAEGLLVVLVGRLTHLVPHITNFDKTYRALIEFGTETDTLDPTGKVIKTGKIPTEEEVRAVLPEFMGVVEQVPPAYSALHVEGKRASDLVREGKSVELKARKITISSIKLLEFSGNHALIEVSCSKGTYIRSLARDIAEKCGTVAHLKELRRTRVGPFELEDAVSEETVSANSLVPMTMEVAGLCGMDSLVLSSAFVSHFNNGRPLKKHMFISDFASSGEKSEIAVFYPDGTFGGVVTRKIIGGKERLSYGFVIPQSQKLKIYSWEQVADGKFASDFKDSGTALTIGSFDGSHLGHRSLFEAVLSQKEKGLIPGVLTFTKSLRGYKNPSEYEGDVVSLSQKIDSIERAGFTFAVIVDFSADFGRIEGRDFLSLLVKNCGLKFLAEGSDFHCGYKGSTGMEEIRRIAAELDFSVSTIDSVIFEGERVSSSRIRSCILKGNFTSVQNMLLKPFELDCTGFQWKMQGENVISAAKKGAQLLPPNGNYRVKVIFVCFGQKRVSENFSFSETLTFKTASSEGLMSASAENQGIFGRSDISGEAQEDRAATADCTLENGNLRLAFSDNLISGFVRSVQFL